MKDDGHTILFMSLFGTLGTPGTEKRRRILQEDGSTTTVTFKYPEIEHNNYSIRDSVDDHNRRRMFPVDIEEQWRIHRWPNRVAAFILAITEINVNYVNHHVYKEELMEQIKFIYKMADELIRNEHYNSERIQNPRATRCLIIASHHKDISLPEFQKFHEGKIVDAKSRWPQWKCKKARDCIKNVLLDL